MSEAANEVFPVWITRYALSAGIIEGTAKVATVGAKGKPACIKVLSGVQTGAILGASDWFPTEKEAIAKATKMRATKMASLKLQLDKLKDLRFEPESGR